MNSALFNLIGLAICLVGLILHIVSMAVPNYAYGNLSQLGDMLKKLDPDGDYGTEDMEIHFGVFRMCANGKIIPGGKDCIVFGTSDDLEHKVKEAPDWLKACQAMSIIGLLFVAGGMGLSILSIVKQSRGDRQRLLPAIIGGLCIFGAGFCIIGDVVYGAKYKDGFIGANTQIAFVPKAFIEKVEDMFHLDWAFAVDIVACVFFMLGGGVQLVGGHMASTNGVV